MPKKKNNEKQKKIEVIQKKKSRKRTKWNPSEIYLVPRKILIEEKDRLMNELSELIFEMNQCFNLQPAEVYEKKTS
jgi:hypothetical protein